MSLINILQEDMKKAIKNKDIVKLNCIKMIITETERMYDKKRNQLKDDEIIKIIKKLINNDKQLQLIRSGYITESELVRAGKNVDKLIENKLKEHNVISDEIEIYQTYIPKETSEEEIKNYILDNGFNSIKNMKELKKQFPNEDGKKLKNILESMI